MQAKMLYKNVKIPQKEDCKFLGHSFYLPFCQKSRKMKNLTQELDRIAAIPNDNEAVDEIIKLSAKQPIDIQEDGDTVASIENIKADSTYDFDFKEDVFINNPAETWDFARKTTVIYPKSLQGLIDAVKFAESKSWRIRGIGSRHSFSNAPAADHCYIDLSKTFTYQYSLHSQHVKLLDQQPLELLKTDIDKRYHINLPAGINIHMINHILHPDNNDIRHFGEKRLFNMGGGDVQTLAGAFSTGTHGSGGKYSAYHDMLRSLLLVCSNGRAFRIEPANGMTDPARNRQFYQQNPNLPQVELIQDDDTFYASLVNMGCFGIFFSVIMEITDMKLLHQEATYVQGGWNRKLKNRFTNGFLPKNPDNEYYYYLQLNPYVLQGRNNPSILIKEIKPTNDPGSGKKETRPKFWPNVFANWNFSVNLIRHLANAGNMPKKRIIESSLRTQHDNQERGKGYTDLAYNIWNAGSGKLKSIGTGIEIAFPVAEAPEVIDILMASMAHIGKKGRGYYLNAPIALRFVRPSKALLAPNYHSFKGQEVKEWCYIEVLRVNSKQADDDRRELEIFQYLQKMMFLAGGRPHWGLNFGFEFTQQLLYDLYPGFEQWKKAFHFFNSNGTFDNPLTRQLGLRESEAELIT